MEVGIRFLAADICAVRKRGGPAVVQTPSGPSVTKRCLDRLFLVARVAKLVNAPALDAGVSPKGLAGSNPVTGTPTFQRLYF
jgi:hypothetical protein